MVKNYFFLNIAKLDLPGNNTHSLSFLKIYVQPGHPGATNKGRPKRKIVAVNIKKSRLEARRFCLKLIII